MKRIFSSLIVGFLLIRELSLARWTGFSSMFRRARLPSTPSPSSECFPMTPLHIPRASRIATASCMKARGATASPRCARCVWKRARLFSGSTLRSEFFGEGITIVKDEVFQLTWKSGVGFVYDVNDFHVLAEIFIRRRGLGTCDQWTRTFPERRNVGDSRSGSGDISGETPSQGPRWIESGRSTERIGVRGRTDLRQCVARESHCADFS